MTLTSIATRTERPVRVARPRRYLMCRPNHFDVCYSINPWMEPEKPTDRELALVQWERLVNLFLGLGHQVEFIDALPGMPDMVFAANGALVVDGKVLAARFRYQQRVAEGPAYADWLRDRGYQVTLAEAINEGEGDYLTTASALLAGTGFRTDPGSHAEAARLFGRPVHTLRLVDPRYYHLDTALAVLDGDEIMYYPAAFAPESQQLLRELYPDAILADDDDAAVFGLNAVSDGRHVLLAPQATNLIEQLWDRGFIPIGVDLSELLKSGGSAKCCTLELRDLPAGG
ncbi:MAG TPA: arginine deiminase-related protein [Jatrophihabitans sp.]|nr:arginine deiminase-related protein [Jatrophihabitans sp.]